MPPAALLAIRRVMVEKPASPVVRASLLACMMLIAISETRIRVVMTAAVRMTLRATDRRATPPRLSQDFAVSFGCAGRVFQASLIASTSDGFGSDERRLGQDWLRPFRSRWSPCHQQ